MTGHRKIQKRKRRRGKTVKQIIIKKGEKEREKHKKRKREKTREKEERTDKMDKKERI